MRAWPEDGGSARQIPKEAGAVGPRGNLPSEVICSSQWLKAPVSARAFSCVQTHGCPRPVLADVITHGLGSPWVFCFAVKFDLISNPYIAEGLETS